jgi:hypothetical protein
VPRWCSRQSSTASRGSGTSLPMADMPGRNCARCSKRSANGRLRSSSDLTLQKGSKCYPGAGSSRAPSHGLIETVALQKTSKTPSKAPPHGSSWLQSSSSHAASQHTAIKQDNYESDSKACAYLLSWLPHRHLLCSQGNDPHSIYTPGLKSGVHFRAMRAKLKTHSLGLDK